MPLIDLQTDLKSLRYGNDRIGGGNSGQPYITTNIPDNISPYIGTTDFLQRGGINVVRDTATDVERIAKMFADTKSPNGILFTAKQQLLSRTAVRTQTSGLLNEGTYSPLNTLAQTGVIVFGGHLNKQGINPFADTGAYANNEALYGVRVKPTQQPEINRLVQLTTGAIESRPITLNGITLNNGINVMTYEGGPGSNLGIGQTAIRYSQINQTPLTRFPGSFNFTTTAESLGQNDWTFSARLLEEQPTQLVQNGISSPKIQDFRRILREKLDATTSEGKAATNSGATPFSPDYNIKNIENRVNLGDPGQRAGKSYANYADGINYSSITIPKIGSFNPGLDKITSLPIYRSENVAVDDNLNDLVKFRIAILDNNVGANGQVFKMFMHFRAFLGPMSDSYTADWSAFKYLGRGENFYTYQGFTRQISLSWTIAAQSKQELIPMYKKLNYLASSLTPDYSPQGYMRGNLAQLTVGGYIYEQPGIITGLTYDIQEDTPWEIGINTEGNSDGTVKEMPHIIRVSGFTFIPIQDFVARKQELAFNDKKLTDRIDENDVGFVTTYGNQRFISLSNGPSIDNSNYNIYDTAEQARAQQSQNQINQLQGRGLSIPTRNINI
jgi:hypothetical protein